MSLERQHHVDIVEIKTRDTLEETLADIQQIIEIEDEEKRQEEMGRFIKIKLTELQKEHPPKAPIALWNSKAESGFLHEETEIKRNIIVDPFKVNDPEIYTYLLDSFANFYTAWNRPAMRGVIGYAVIYALGNYFGNFYSSQNTERDSREFYMDRSSSDSEPIDLREFKGKQIAVCAEKASVAHNYLKFLAIDSHLIFSERCKLTTDSEEAHAYICFSTPNGQFIFDPTNSIIVKNAEGMVNSVEPALYKITPEQFGMLVQRKGGEVTVIHKNKTWDGQQYLFDETERTYT